MPAYRLEVSSSNRAACNGKLPCKGNKIMKGELRLGTWVQIRDNGSFKWRHWGCVTEAQIQNLQKDFPNPDDVDGFEELP
ncbi:poly polymerase and DNA-ligase Zn-finger region-domain-containing protein [Kockovaella imperatae]|uniref:Poly polymerase and DNA-ligase Zn-finger region-domain-containing protein n=1 Tax=Kockovaella imperatae TaxID=4999 RepID=A0A1Y1UBN1_9TREE|nr:poly polymerase and DNA-ligase Zn-finger region-domain-containing protein [Kockovaella imperatae]ORX35402.1 poly polymerase and DNA-ligase Zn-finger region-domain-containing protein [Kockovaella imperatae]